MCVSEISMTGGCPENFYLQAFLFQLKLYIISRDGMAAARLNAFQASLFQTQQLTPNYINSSQILDHPMQGPYVAT